MNKDEMEVNINREYVERLKFAESSADFGVNWIGRLVFLQSLLLWCSTRPYEYIPYETRTYLWKFASLAC